jgi:hypothetical protein
MKEILKIRQDIIAKRPDLWPVLQRAAGNGGSRVASEMAEEFARLDALVRRIQATGAILKDINLGLLDFLSKRDGREVYLCWRYGEDRIEFWHELHTGYSGRQPL